MPDLDTRIAEIAGRVEAATEGPWTVEAWINPSAWGVRLSEKGRTIDCGRNANEAEFIAHARQDIPFLLAALQQTREALVDLIGAYEHATEHITKELQPEFEKLAETGTLTWRWPNKPYDQSQAAWRLATWWHGVGTDERLERARAALAPEQTEGTA